MARRFMGFPSEEERIGLLFSLRSLGADAREKLGIAGARRVGDAIDPASLEVHPVLGWTECPRLTNMFAWCPKFIGKRIRGNGRALGRRVQSCRQGGARRLGSEFPILSCLPPPPLLS